MRYFPLPLLVALVAVGLSPAARAQTPASCALGTAQADLNINNALGRVFNTGSLFYGNGFANFYFIPSTSQSSPVYASGLWVGGIVDGDIRVAGGTYDGTGLNYSFWPGPLGADGQPANPTCAGFDRIYSVSRSDIANAEAGSPTGDVLDWPFELGAPVVDSEGNPKPLLDSTGTANTYNFAAGDRPAIIGDQGLWWVMNDVGNVHAEHLTDPLGIEVQVLAFAFSRSDALGSTSFYRYRVINKGPSPITETYLSIFSDPDLGDAADDLVGSDIESGLGFVYNSDNADGDGSPPSYGTPAPAIGYDFFQGPIVDGDTLSTSAFSYFVNGDPDRRDPQNGEEVYNLQQGLFVDGSEMKAFGTGYGQTQGEVTKFAYPGDPVTGEFWSEFNSDNNGTDNQAGDRRFAIHTGPFTLQNVTASQPADSVAQDIVFGIVFGQGADNIGSITALRAADRLAQTAYNINFRLAPPPPPPALCADRTGSTESTADDFGSGNCLEAVEQDGTATLVWGYPETSTNYLGRFEEIDQLLVGQGAADSTYNFEGFNIYRYTSSSFDLSTRELVQTFDVDNGVETVREIRLDPTVGAENTFITARGTDSGVQYTYDIPGLTNYTDYFYGISAYAFNEESIPKVNESAVTFITVRPAGLTGGIAAQSALGDTLATSASRNGLQSIIARVVDPTALTGDTYEVRFFNPTTNGVADTTQVTYSIVNTTQGTTVLDGQEYFQENGAILPDSSLNVRVVDGFTFDVRTELREGFQTFQTLANAAGRLPIPVYASSTAAAGFPSLGDPDLELITVAPTTPVGVPTEDQQVADARWIIQQGEVPLVASFASFLSVVTRNGANDAAIGDNDYEWRFTGNSLAYRPADGGSLVVPFELWDLGTSPGRTPAATADDVRLIPYITAVGTPDEFDLGTVDHRFSAGNDDPFTDLVSWYRPTNTTPGSAGYDAFAAGDTPNLGAVGEQIFAGMTLGGLNAGPIAAPQNYVLEAPERGTIFRVIRFKTTRAGDVYTINTGDFRTTESTETTRVDALERIEAVPNPYLGTSEYESGNLSRVIRFTNLPEETATIRIFTVSGSLVNTLRKDGPGRSLDWNLETSNNLPVASGMYLVHVDIEGVGERTLKVGIVNRRTQISIF